MANNTVAYGFVGLDDLYDTRVSQVNAEISVRALEESFEDYSAQVQAMLSAWVAPTEKAQEMFEQPGAGTLQPLDEYGVPRATRGGGQYTVAYPIRGAGDAYGADRVANKLITMRELNNQVLRVMTRDMDWMRRHMLAAIFTDVTRTFVDKVGPDGSKGLGSITVQPLAIASDSQLYVKTGTVPATDTHYLAQADAISDSANPFDDIYEELMEHPSNVGPVVVYIPTSLVATTKGLTGFYDIIDPNLIYGNDTTRLSREITAGPGELIGYTDQCYIKQWRALPSGYMIAHCPESGPFMKMREYPHPGLKGLFVEPNVVNGHLEEARFLRYCDFGIYRREGAVVYRVGNASYADPTGYTAPLAV